MKGIIQALYEANALAPADMEGYKKEQEAQQKLNQGMKKGGKVSSASKRADGCAIKGKTKGKMV